MSWENILKARGNSKHLSVFKVSEDVRNATVEWSKTIEPGRSFFIRHIRKAIIPILEDILMPKLEPTINLTRKKDESDDNYKRRRVIQTQRVITIFINKHFNLKEAEISKFDKTIFNLLVSHPDWNVTGKTAHVADFVKV